MIIATSLVAAALPWFGTSSLRMSTAPPQPYTEKVALPGKAPDRAEDLLATWEAGYTLENVRIEDENTKPVITLTVELKDDATYRLLYGARWGDLLDVGGGLNVSETGIYSLSGEILLLEPRLTTRTDLKSNVVVKKQEIPGVNQVWIVHREKKTLHVVGRCPKYWIEPVCGTSPNVWVKMQIQTSGMRIAR